MTLKDISFSGFFKIFFVIQTFMFLAGFTILTVFYFINPDKVTFGPAKLINMITIHLDGVTNSPIVFLIIGIMNTFIGIIFSALIAKILTKVPFIGRIKISPKAYDEKVFD